MNANERKVLIDRFVQLQAIQEEAYKEEQGAFGPKYSKAVREACGIVDRFVSEGEAEALKQGVAEATEAKA